MFATYKTGLDRDQPYRLQQPHDAAKLSTDVPSTPSNAMDGIRVLVVDSNRLSGHLVADTLRKDRRLTISNAEAKSVIVTATIFKPEVAIVSEQLQGKRGQGFAVVRELRQKVPSTRTVMLLDASERDLVVEAFRSGARGVFCRSDSLKMLTRCVCRVHEGQLWMSDLQLEFLLECLAKARTTQLVDAQGAGLLSRREQEVVRCLSEGRTNDEIALELNISANTVKNYLFRIFNKLGVSSRVEVVIYAANQNAGRVTAI